MSDTSASQPATQPVFPRAACTLLVLREGTSGPEVLMGRRAAGHRFMPNSLVFPGGAVDAADADGPIATSFPAHVTRLVDRLAGPELAHSLGVALARELEEETGLHLGHPPALDGLDCLCRAITPATRPRRFDAWFFVAWSDSVIGSLAASDELEEVRFFPLSELVTVDLEFATRGSLDQLGEWLAMSEEQRRDRTTLPVMREKVWHQE
jgi:8-oxo-dGTP pyrophosphatase MutT (NUDIX family)